jgi:hypothetical protein
MLNQKTNQFKYKQINNAIVKGFFNIYQAVNGKIYIMMGNSYTPLTLEQVQDLNIDIYSLENFDIELFKKVYYKEIEL